MGALFLYINLAYQLYFCNTSLDRAVAFPREAYGSGAISKINIMQNSDLLTYEILSDKEHKNSNKIAWVIGIVLAFIVLAIVWATMQRNQQEANNRATDFAFRTNERVGRLEGNQVVVGEILNTTTGNVSALLQSAAANTTNVAAQGKVLDDLAIITANTGCNSGGSCGSGIPRFRKTNEYTLCNSRMFENDICGDA